MTIKKFSTQVEALVACELFRNLLPKQDDNKINTLRKAKALVACEFLRNLLP